MALFTLTELASYLQRDLDTATATLARELAEGLVTDVTGPLDLTTSTATLPVQGLDDDRPYIGLPTTRVVSVASVTVSGIGLGVTDWEWQRPHPRIRLHRVPAQLDTPWQYADRWITAAVTFTHGFPTPPPPVKAVALAVAGRVYDNPRGLRQESIDDYSLTRAGGDEDLIGLTLTETERLALARAVGDNDHAYTTAVRW